MGIRIHGRCNTCGRSCYWLGEHDPYCSDKCKDPLVIRRYRRNGLIHGIIATLVIASYVFGLCVANGHSVLFGVMLGLVIGSMTVLMCAAV